MFKRFIIIITLLIMLLPVMTVVSYADSAWDHISVDTENGSTYLAAFKSEMRSLYGAVIKVTGASAACAIAYYGILIMINNAPETQSRYIHRIIQIGIAVGTIHFIPLIVTAAANIANS